MHLSVMQVKIKFRLSVLWQKLLQIKLNVWYDEFTLKVGDSLRRKIDTGLRNSDFGIVILSKNFFLKNWPQTELDGLYAKAMAGTRKIILPV
jgi:TIR domain